MMTEKYIEFNLPNGLTHSIKNEHPDEYDDKTKVHWTAGKVAKLIQDNWAMSRTLKDVEGITLTGDVLLTFLVKANAMKTTKEPLSNETIGFIIKKKVGNKLISLLYFSPLCVSEIVELVNGDTDRLIRMIRYKNKIKGQRKARRLENTNNKAREKNADIKLSDGKKAKKAKKTPDKYEPSGWLPASNVF